MDLRNARRERGEGTFTFKLRRAEGWWEKPEGGAGEGV